MHARSALAGDRLGQKGQGDAMIQRAGLRHLAKQPHPWDMADSMAKSERECKLRRTAFNGDRFQRQAGRSRLGPDRIGDPRPIGEIISAIDYPTGVVKNAAPFAGAEKGIDLLALSRPWAPACAPPNPPPPVSAPHTGHSGSGARSAPFGSPVTTLVCRTHPSGRPRPLFERSAMSGMACRLIVPGTSSSSTLSQCPLKAGCANRLSSSHILPGGRYLPRMIVSWSQSIAPRRSVIVRKPYRNRNGTGSNLIPQTKVAHRFDAAAAFGKRLQQHPRYQLGQPHALADMRGPLAKGQMPVRAARRVHPHRGVERRVVAVAAAEPGRYLVPRLERSAMHVEIPRGAATETRQRTNSSAAVPQSVADCIRHPDAALASEQVGLTVQHQNIAIATDRPERLARDPFRPVQRIVAAQSGQGVVWWAVHEHITAALGRGPVGHVSVLADAVQYYASCSGS